MIQRGDLPSDHAPVAVTITVKGMDLDSTLARASSLGGHAALCGPASKVKQVKKPLRFHMIDKGLFSRNIGSRCDDINMDANIDLVASQVAEVVYSVAERSVGRTVAGRYQDTLSRWERLLGENDDSEVWKAINWKGELNSESKSFQNDDTRCPTDDEFRRHFENVLNPPGTEIYEVETDITIPVLDSVITGDDIQRQLNKLKPNKACGPDGISPGLLTLLPAEWIVTLCTLFNNVFFSASYPLSWTKATMFTLFKKGNRMDANNYRGITVINCIAKLYDMLLCDRLNLWFSPPREQAGAQRKRGCVEHITTLRLLTDTARRKKKKLFVTFVDFSKAYDLVPRNVLFNVLKRIGCGKVMLSAIVAMYRVTQCVIGAAVMSATLGVRQGSPTSCFLFVVFVNELIKMMKNACQDDDFLEWLHLLSFMDDTVLLATTRVNMIRKIEILKRFCSEFGMKINQEKTKFFVINGSYGDANPICIDDWIVSSCTSYIYLGSPFTCDGSASSAVKLHAKNKLSHVLKFVNFLRKNNDVPFIVKKRVLDAALMSSLLYGCESWLGVDLKPVTKLYNWAVKQLLGVRRSTSNFVCYTELGYPCLEDLVKQKQHKFFVKMWRERQEFHDDPLMLAMRMVRNANVPAGRLINSFLDSEVPTNDDIMNIVREKLRTKTTSRCVIYKEINPDLVINPIYVEKHCINELHRMSFTRFRVSGHSLAIETGRWNRRGRGRLPFEERLCGCGQVQTERHVVQDCPLTHNIRQMYNIEFLEDLFSGKYSPDIACRISYEILDIYR